VIVLIAVPFVGKKGERSPKRRPWALAFVLTVAVLGVVLVREGRQAPWSPDLAATPFSAGFVAQADAQGLSQGADLFFSKGCIACHTVAGTGGKRGPNLSSVGDRLSDDQLTWRILNGGHNMPAFGSILTPDNVHELVAFLKAQRSP
jgi:ubiquinol-cytochrome c reductase cytochrome b subunit